MTGTKKTKSPVEKWLDKHSKSAPFYIVKAVPLAYHYRWDRLSDDQLAAVERDGQIYTVIWKERSSGYIKIGKISDGAHTRYGFSTFGVLKGPTAMHLWQSVAGVVSEEEFNLMTQLRDTGALDLPILDLHDLKDLKH